MTLQSLYLFVEFLINKGLIAYVPPILSPRIMATTVLESSERAMGVLRRPEVITLPNGDGFRAAWDSYAHLYPAMSPSTNPTSYWEEYFELFKESEDSPKFFQQMGLCLRLRTYRLYVLKQAYDRLTEAIKV